jgi:protein SCO1/2
MQRRYTIWLFLAAVTVLPLSVYGVVKWYENAFQKLPYYGAAGHTVANFKLQDQHGQFITTDDWNNKVVVANLFFTHCPVVCPKMTRNLKTVQAIFAKDKNIALYSFTVDPETDSVQKLAAYALKFGVENNWHLLTGNKMDIYRLARKSLLLAATDGDGGPDDFIHSDKLVLIDAQKRIRVFYDVT